MQPEQSIGQKQQALGWSQLWSGMFVQEWSDAQDNHLAWCKLHTRVNAGDQWTVLLIKKY
eukprot:6683975-Ditylum_brightwellii.AAC.1